MLATAQKFTTLLLLIALFSRYSDTPVWAADTSLLVNPWMLSGQNGATEVYAAVDAGVLQGKSEMQVTYDLNGLCAMPGDASALILDQDGWKAVSLSDYGTNCLDGEQTVTIPLSNFKDIDSGEVLDLSRPLTGQLHARFWSSAAFDVEVTQIRLGGAPSLIEVDVVPTPTSEPMTLPTATEATLGPSVMPTPTVETTEFDGLVMDADLADRINVRYDAKKELSRVGFFVDGQLINVESQEPYYLGGDTLGEPLGWDTQQLDAGTHELMVELEATDGSVTREKKHFRIRGERVTPSPTPTSVAIQVSLTPAPTVAASSPAFLVGKTWELQSVDAMKDTKDAICNQRSDDWIRAWVGKAKELGATHVAISMPYDNPSCGDAEAYAAQWISSIREGGLNVWHRQMPMAFEGIYSVAKQTHSDGYVGIVRDYIVANKGHYQAGDVFTPIPEPQNGGISGITHCAQGVCQFSSKEHFNSWIREVTAASKQAFATIGLADMKVGYYGFDGFVAWGANNPDWNGILEDETVRVMGNITIDHYPESIGSTMEQGLNELEARYPGVPIVIGEWGTITGGDVEQQVKDSMGAAARHNVIGFNYWHFGPGGAGEQLIEDGFITTPQFDEVQAFYRR